MKNKKVILLITLLFLAIGFAAVSTTLVINGVINIASNKDDFNIIFTDAKLNGIQRNDLIEQSKKQSITFETDKLIDVNDEAVLDYEVTNTSQNYDAEVAINCIAEKNEFVIIDYEPKKLKIEAGKRKLGSITAKLIRPSTEDKNISVTCTLNVTAKERTSLGKEAIVLSSGTMMSESDNNTIPRNETFWKYKRNITNIIFENQISPVESSLEFDISAAQDGSVMAYLYSPDLELTIPQEEIDAQFEEYVENEYGMPLEEYKTYLIEEEYYTEEDVNYELLGIKHDLFQLSDEEKKLYFEAYIMANFGMSLEEYKTFLIEAAYYTEEDVNREFLYTKYDLNLLTENDKYMFAVVQTELDYGMSIEEYKKYYMEEYGHTEVDFIDHLEEVKYELFPNDESYILFIQSEEEIKANPNSSYWFSNFKNLEEISGLEYIDTSNVIDMSYMFHGCSKLTSIDVSNFDTGNARNMSHMFSGCSEVTNLDIGHFDTSSASNMSNMFQGCQNLTSLDVSNFDTRNATNLSHMFSGCRKVTNLDIGHFDTSKVIDMSWMFHECHNLTSVDVINFDTRNATNLSYIFSECYSIASLDISNFDTENVTNMAGMFSNCNKLKKLDVSHFETSKVTDMSWMFHGCQNLTSLDISRFDTRNVRNMAYMFSTCRYLKEYDLSHFDTSNVISMKGMFYLCDSLIKLNISSFDFSNVSEKDYIFFHDSKTATIIVKDEAAQNWILALTNNDGRRPVEWTIDNVITLEQYNNQTEA